MPRLRRLPYLLVPALVAIAIAIPAAASGTSPSAQAAAKCPTFRVLHNDKIGKISLPAGNYNVTTRNLTCASSTTWFARFLQDWDGKLPRPWKASSTGPGNVTFTGGTRSFTANRIGTSSGGRGRLECSQAYTLRHADRIGRLVLKKGKYRIVRLSTISPRCPRAGRLLTRFLEDFDGQLPGNWVLLAQTGTFANGSVQDGFRVEPWVGGGGGNTPDSRAETRCNVNFHVLHNDRIGPLRFPAGRYSIDVRNLTCQRASSLFSRFLSIPSGRLTGGWKINAQTGTIFKGRKSFQPKPNFVVR
jgi:hypothetical protein